MEIVLKKIQSNWKILSVILLSVILRLANVINFDVGSDGGHYAFRSLGWLDYLGSPFQTTPIEWFGLIPWWSNLSFHDAPPLFFLTQHVTSFFVGDSPLMVRLPGIVASAITIWIIFILLRKYKNEKIALLSSFIFAISSMMIWANIYGFIESVLVVFVTLSSYFFFVFVKESSGSDYKYSNLYYSSVFLACALLTKYSSVFLIPVFIIFYLIYRRNNFKKDSKRLAGAILLIVLFLTPIIIYNIGVFDTRGHFDAAISTAVGMHPTDNAIFMGREIKFNLFGGISAVARSFGTVNSIFIILLTLGSLVYLSYKIYRRQNDEIDSFLILSVFVITTAFCFWGSADRYLPIFMPFISMGIGICAIEVYEKIKKENVRLSMVWGIVITVLVAGEIIYSLNTNVTSKPIINLRGFYSQSRAYNTGFKELENYIKKEIFLNPTSINKDFKISNFYSMSKERIEEKNVLFFDDRIEWFRYMWHVFKFKIYYDMPLLPMAALIVEEPLQFFEKMRNNGAKSFYFLETIDASVRNGESKSEKENFLVYDKIFGDLKSGGLMINEIKDYKGDVTFRLYKVN